VESLKKFILKEPTGRAMVLLGLYVKSPAKEGVQLYGVEGKEVFAAIVILQSVVIGMHLVFIAIVEATKSVVLDACESPRRTNVRPELSTIKS
jgi:hypothetical protein